MKKLIILIPLLCSILSFSQKRYFTRSGNISFNAGTSVEDIDAINKAATSVLDISTGQLEFAVLIKGFEFKRALMQDHFNENYLESEKYPKSVFRGKVDLDPTKLQQPGKYDVTIRGKLEMHGISKDIEVPGQLTVGNGTIDASTTFSVLLSDYNITVPGLVRDKISKTVKITVVCKYTELK